MLKKILITGAFVGSIGLNVYLLNSEVVMHDDLDSDIIEIDDEISLAQSALQKKVIKIDKNGKQINKIRKDLFPESNKNNKSTELVIESDDIEVNKEINIQANNLKWKDAIAEKFELDGNLSSKLTDKYLSIRNDRQKEIDLLLSDKFKTLKETETLFLSMEDNIEISKINEKYLNLLKEILGDKAYNLYKKAKVNFNKNSLEPNSDTFFVEF